MDERILKGGRDVELEHDTLGTTSIINILTASLKLITCWEIEFYLEHWISSRESSDFPHESFGPLPPYFKKLFIILFRRQSNEERHIDTHRVSI